MGREEIKQICKDVLSKNGTVKYEDLPPIGKVTWDAFERGFLKCFEYLTTPDTDKYEVCADCHSAEIIYSECVCVTEKRYPTIELEFDICRCCGHTSTLPNDSEFNDQQYEDNN